MKLINGSYSTGGYNSVYSVMPKDKLVYMVMEWRTITIFSQMDDDSGEL